MVRLFLFFVIIVGISGYGFAYADADKDDKGEHDIDYYISKLKGGDIDEKFDAIDCLSELWPEEAVPYFIDALLQEQDIGIRVQVALVLGIIGDKRAVPPLLSLLSDPELNDPDNLIRREAIAALGEIGDKRAIYCLSSLLSNEDCAIVAAAITALKKVDSKYAVSELIPLLDNEIISNVVAEALCEIKDRKGVDAVVKAINKGKVGIDPHLITLLGVTKNRRIKTILYKTIKHKNFIFRKATIYALSFFKKNDRKCLALIIEATRDSNSGVRQEAVWMLSGMNKPKVIEALLERWNDEDGMVRLPVRCVLGGMHPNGLKYFLITQLKTNKKKQKIIECLQEYTGQNFGNDIAKWLEWWKADQARIQKEEEEKERKNKEKE